MSDKTIIPDAIRSVVLKIQSDWVLTTKGKQTRQELVSRIHATSPALGGLTDQERGDFLALLRSLERVGTS